MTFTCTASIWNNASSEGQLQEWNNWPKYRWFIWLIWLKADWLEKRCSTENRDFIHTTYTKIHCFISDRNEVLPLHKHLNSGSGKNHIANGRYCGLQPTCLEYDSPSVPILTSPKHQPHIQQHTSIKQNEQPCFKMTSVIHNIKQNINNITVNTLPQAWHSRIKTADYKDNQWGKGHFALLSGIKESLGSLLNRTGRGVNNGLLMIISGFLIIPPDWGG